MGSIHLIENLADFGLCHHHRRAAAFLGLHRGDVVPDRLVQNMLIQEDESI
jgi:hypothetical protein